MLRNSRGSVSTSLCIFFLMIFCVWGGVRIVAEIVFDRNCGGYLKRAADANTVELARIQLEKAVSYMEKQDLTEGYTSVIYQTPDEDIGYWYQNIKESLKELDELRPDATPLERSNLLIKLRETLLDDTSSGVSVTVPMGISVYPYNAPLYWMAWISSVACCIFGVIWIKQRSY